MSNLKLDNNVIIGNYKKPYITAELNTSHFGEISQAKKLIHQAKLSGCDAIKLQSWTSESLYSKSFYKKNPISKRLFDKFSLSEEQMFELWEYSKKIKIDFCSTPYSKIETDFLVEKLNVPYLKVASMDLNNYNYIGYLASKGKPIVLSTGMGDLNEIKKAVNTIEAVKNNNICILHCVALYPPKTSQLQLNNISGFMKSFPNYPIGYSDHSPGIEMAISAVALGASMIEKHFTLDKTKIGMDNQMAIEPNEMKMLVEKCNNVHIAMGNRYRSICKEEIQQRRLMRRSIVSQSSIKKGSIINRDDLNFKRPGTGISPDNIRSVIGKKALKDIPIDTLIKKEDISK
ncbi:MAG: N-acetylneuraminate synthase family protein [Candidatus Neomarinimicrobiota bacterium]